MKFLFIYFILQTNHESWEYWCEIPGLMWLATQTISPRPSPFSFDQITPRENGLFLATSPRTALKQVGSSTDWTPDFVSRPDAFECMKQLVIF